MINLNIKGNFGKFGYTQVADDLVEELLLKAGEVALKTAIKKAPYDPNDPPYHLREHIHSWFDKAAQIFYVIAASIYANIAEYGSSRRLEHPYIRPASKAAQRNIKSNTKKAVTDSVNAEKGRIGV